jgi:teichoic acid transport system permease protein
MNRRTYLGGLWNVFTPLLTALVWVFLFGFLLGTSRGVTNGVAFIVVGYMTYRVWAACFVGGGHAVTGHTALVRSVRFPRAVLPIAQCLTEFLTFLPGVVIMCLTAWASSYLSAYSWAGPTWRWVLLPVPLVLYFMFNQGCVFMTARLVAVMPDLRRLFAVVVRFMMFTSGIMFSIPYRFRNVEGMPEWLLHVFACQPVAIFLEMVRSCVLSEPTIPIDKIHWLLGVVWAVLFLVVGFVFFWRGENRYGRL